MLAACGKTVLISDYFEYYRLAAYLARYTKEKIGITMGAGSLCELFDEKYYAQLDGGILESFGRLFKNDLKLYIYPLLDRQTGELTTVENLQVAPELRNLYEYLVERGCIEQLDNYNPGIPVDLLARRDRADQSGRSLVERPRAQRSRRRDPPPWLLWPPAIRPGERAFDLTGHCRRSRQTSRANRLQVVQRRRTALRRRSGGWRWREFLNRCTSAT